MQHKYSQTEFYDQVYLVNTFLKDSMFCMMMQSKTFSGQI